MNHTPGPWTVGVADWSESGNARYEIKSQKHVCAADARLIAAAPDMLLALRRAALALSFAAEKSGAMQDDYEAVSAAISKATGVPK